MTPDETAAENEASLADDPAVRQAIAESVRGDVRAVVTAHPASPLAWAELADSADSSGHVVEAFAFATVAADLAREQLAAAGWQPGSPVPWSDEPNRAYLRALDAQRRAAEALGLRDRAAGAARELADADAEAPARIASEYTPTQVISIVDLEASAGRGTEAPATIGDPIAAPEAAGAAGED
ncbi:DUF3151 family protein [Agromyces agglutinans]|uniref:DUF3151 family protein n=1 Tax=Agromyces agglutinans TaxID=2662258 RepID=UPI0015624A15|nr:DUF3151 family protein [Agromyces agglutinans]